MIQRTIRRILREDEMSHWHSDEQWKNDEEMFGPDKGWVPDEQWKKDQNWPQKGDEGGGSDMSETDEMGWIKEVPTGLKLEPGKRYIIDCCEEGYDEYLFEEKIVEFFSYLLKDDWKIPTPERIGPVINWFDNRFIRKLDNKVLLSFLFELSEDGEGVFIRGEWLTCDVKLETNFSHIQSTDTIITPKEFLNSWYLTS